MKKTVLSMLALFLSAATSTWAQDPIDLTPNADGTEWTLASMPDGDVELEIEYYNYPAATLTSAPTAKTDLLFTGQPLELITAGTATNGTLYYALGTADAAPTEASDWSTDVPTASAAGKYYVWYKVLGDDTHNGIDPAGPLTVTVAIPATYTVTANLANGAYWATFYTEAGNYQAPDGTQVFAVNLNTTTAEITMTEISDRIVKSGEGVVLKKTTTGNFTMTWTATAPGGNFSNNSLTGTMTQINTTGANDYYVLNYKESTGVGFYKLSNTSGTIGANKAYLTYAGALAREFFLFDEATGIEMPTVEDVNADAVVYDLQGRRVVNPTKGLYIVNGKKVFINK